ncbi:MAG: protein kinase, partial [Candidatus Schekmanbacteria bacterium]|nr:protein kinase [Candidatus Schekmanbacteria bacterium]
RQTGKSEMFGTPGAMPVEQSRRAIDAVPRSDIFALGCVLYELWCGRAAFPVRTFDASGRAEQAQPARWPTEIVAPFPAELEAVLRECFALAPEARPFPGVLGARLAAWAELDAERDRLLPPAVISYLDLPVTRLVGREDELAEIAKAGWAVCRPGSAGPRLGLVGAAGSGKHRLATEARVAWERASLLVVRLRFDRIAAGAVAEELVARVRRVYPGAELAAEEIAALDAGAAETVARVLAPTWESASALILERLDAASEATRAFAAALLGRFAGVALVTAETEDALVGLGARVRRLEALAAAEVAELSRAVLGGPLGAGAAELMSAAPRLPGTLIDWLGEQVAVGGRFRAWGFGLRARRLGRPVVGSARRSPGFRFRGDPGNPEPTAAWRPPLSPPPASAGKLGPERATRSSLSPDALLARGHIGSCRLLSFLGQGGMGMVFRGELDGRQAAVKVTRMADERAAARFRAEMRALSAFAHPHIVRMLDVVHDQELGMVGLVMEYLPRTLARAIAEGIDQETAIRIGWQLAQALDFVTTTMAAAHRDLKPDNVMLTADGTVRLTDFGLLGPVVTGTTGGTLAYMAPEVLARHLGRACSAPIDARADIYSFAWLMHEVFTGNTPLPRPATTREDYACRIDGDPPILSAAIPGRLRSLLRRCLDRDPANRPGSFVEVCAEWNLEAMYPDLQTARWRLAWAYVGRRELQRQVGALLEGTAQPQLVVVRGERGTGKTRFLLELAAELKTAGRTVVLAAAAPASETVPLGAPGEGLVLLVDDLEASAPAHELLAWAARNRVLVVATTAAGHQIAAPARVLELPPLVAADVQELLERVFGKVYDLEEIAAALFVATGGTPRLLIAILGELIASGAVLSLPTLYWRIEMRRIEEVLGSAALAELAAACRVRMAELSADAAVVYRVVWLAGVWLAPAGVAAALCWSEDRATAALDALGKRVLRAADGRVRPANAMARPDGREPGLADLDVEALAEALRGEDRLRALRLLREAGSPGAAAFGMALVEELSQEDAYRDLITALEMLGRPDDDRAWFSCLICYLQALRCVPERVADADRLREVTREAIELAERLADPRLEARAYAARSMTRALPIDQRRADAERAFGIAETYSDRHDAYAEACAAVAVLSEGDGFQAAIADMIERLQAVCFVDLSPFALKLVLSALVNVSESSLPISLRSWLGAQAREVLRSERNGARSAIGTYAGLILSSLLEAGGDYDANYHCLLATSERMAVTNPYYAYVHASLTVTAAELGCLAEARRYASRSECYATEVSNLVNTICQQAELARLSGDLGAALAAISRARRHRNRVSPTVRTNLDLTWCDLLVDLGAALQDADIPTADDEIEAIFSDCTRVRARLACHDCEGAGEILERLVRRVAFGHTEESLGLHLLALRHAAHWGEVARAEEIRARLEGIGPRRRVEADALLAYARRDAEALQRALSTVSRMDLAPIEVDILCKLVWCAGRRELEGRLRALLAECASGLPAPFAATFNNRWEREIAWLAARYWH